MEPQIVWWQTLVDGQAEVRGELLIQPERIPAIEDDLLDDGALPIRQFLGHARKLGIEDPQEKWEGMGICLGV